MPAYRPKTKINAAPTAISTPTAIHGVDRFGFDPVGMMLSNRYSPRIRSAGAIDSPQREAVILPQRLFGGSAL